MRRRPITEARVSSYLPRKKLKAVIMEEYWHLEHYYSLVPFPSVVKMAFLHPIEKFPVNLSLFLISSFSSTFRVLPLADLTLNSRKLYSLPCYSVRLGIPYKKKIDIYGSWDSYGGQLSQPRSNIIRKKDPREAIRCAPVVRLPVKVPYGL